MVDRLLVIWHLQAFLNNETLKANGYDVRLDDFVDEANKLNTEKNGLLHWWIQQYSFCALTEVQEYERELHNVSSPLVDHTRTVKEELELIDVLHFLVSMAQVSGMSYMDYRKALLLDIEDKGQDVMKVLQSLSAALPVDNHHVIRDQIFKVITLLPWKHWSKKKDFDLSLVRDAIVDSMRLWLNYCAYVGMSAERIIYLYEEKNKVNIERQKSQTYSEDTKKPDEGHIK